MFLRKKQTTTKDGNMYNLYVDKPTDFECDVSVKNANLKDAFARMIISANNTSLLFEGKIQNNKCIIPIGKLKGFFTEDVIGKMKLEIVVENTYFSPWSDDFKTEEHTSVKVEVKEQKELSNKPIVEVKVKETSKETAKEYIQRISVPAQELVSICKIFEIGSKNYKTTKRKDFKQLVLEYFKQNLEFRKKMTPILNEVITNLK